MNLMSPFLLSPHWRVQNSVPVVKAGEGSWNRIHSTHNYTVLWTQFYENTGHMWTDTPFYCTLWECSKGCHWQSPSTLLVKCSGLVLRTGSSVLGSVESYWKGESILVWMDIVFEGAIFQQYQLSLGPWFSVTKQARDHASILAAEELA